MSSDADEAARSIRSAGWCLVLAGAALVVVIVYLLAVLTPMGLTFDMFDDARALIEWSGRHEAAYISLYLIYVSQQFLLLAAPLLLWRSLPDGGPLLRTLAASAGLVSIGLAALSSALLIMATHTALQYWPMATTDEMRFQVEMMFDGSADLAKGARLVSEPFLAIWLVWLGCVLRGRGRTSWRRLWWLVVAVGAWTAVVGVWKLIDPLMEFEDRVAFLVGGAQVAAGIGLLRSARRL